MAMSSSFPEAYRPYPLNYLEPLEAKAVMFAVKLLEQKRACAILKAEWVDVQCTSTACSTISKLETP